MAESIVVYFVDENGFMNHNYVKYTIDMFTQKGYTVEDIGMGSAYNMPVYLCGEIAANIEKAVVASYYFKEEQLVPIILFSEYEIDCLLEELEADMDGDSFDILKRVHSKLRER